MNKEATLNEIYQSAYNDELEKIAEEDKRTPLTLLKVLDYTATGAATGGLASYALGGKVKRGLSSGALIGALASAYNSSNKKKDKK